MASPVTPVLELEGIEKRYQGLRPLRLQSLAIAPGERVAMLGVDAGAAEVLVNLVTGASVADRGAVRVLGRNNADIADGDDWLASLDRFGIVSPRAVLLEGATLEQNLAMPFTLQIDPVAPEIARRVSELAVACGLGDGDGAAIGTAGGGCLTRAAGAGAPGAGHRARPGVAGARASDCRSAGGCGGCLRGGSRGGDRGPPPGDAGVDAGSGVRAAGRAPRAEVEPGDRRVDAGAPGVVLLTGYLVITPQATLGPPLTPDFGSPVMPWSSLP